MSLFKLPNKKLIGVEDATFFKIFTNEEYDWKNFIPKTVDTPELPMAWTTYQQSLIWDGTEDDYIDSEVIVMPDAYYGKLHTVVRKPRMVLFNLDSFTGYTGSGIPDIDIGSIFDPIADQLKAKHVIVAKNYSVYGSGTQAIFRMFLPHYDEQEIIDVEAFDTIVPLVQPDDWAAGQILYLDALDCFGFFQAFAYPGSAAFPGSPGDDEFYEMTDYNAFCVQQIIDSYSRYEKFGHHLVFALSPEDELPFTEFVDPDIAYNFVKGIVEDNVALLSGYGVTLDIYDSRWTFTDSSDRTAIEDLYRNKVIEFFELEV